MGNEIPSNILFGINIEPLQTYHRNPSSKFNTCKWSAKKWPRRMYKSCVQMEIEKPQECKLGNESSYIVLISGLPHRRPYPRERERIRERERHVGRGGCTLPPPKTLYTQASNPLEASDKSRGDHVKACPPIELDFSKYVSLKLNFHSGRANTEQF